MVPNCWGTHNFSQMRLENIVFHNNLFFQGLHKATIPLIYFVYTCMRILSFALAVAYVYFVLIVAIMCICQCWQVLQTIQQNVKMESIQSFLLVLQVFAVWVWYGSMWSVGGSCMMFQSTLFPLVACLLILCLCLVWCAHVVYRPNIYCPTHH